MKIEEKNADSGECLFRSTEIMPDGMLMKLMAAPSGIRSQLFTHLVNTEAHFNHGRDNKGIHHQGATIICPEPTKRNLVKPGTANQSDYTCKPSCNAGLTTLKNAVGTFRFSLATMVTRVLESSFGHYVSNGDLLQGLFMLILSLPRVAITKTKQSARVSASSGIVMAKHPCGSVNKPHDQKQ